MQKIDKDLVIELYKKYMYRDRQGIKSQWRLIIKDYQIIKGEDKPRSREQLRKCVKGKTKAIWDSVYKEGETSDYNESQKPSSELEILEDGTHRLLAYKEMSEEQSKDPEFVMRVNGYDPTKWELIRLRVSEWTARNADKEELYNYQIRLDVRPKPKDKLTLEDIKKVNREYVYVHPEIELTHDEGDKALEVGLADLHIGSDFFDENLYMQTIKRISNFAKETPNLEKVYLAWYGDILHVDNTNKTTVKGTQLEMSMSAYDMYRKAKEMVDFTITEFAFTNVDVYWVQGNHSRLAEFILFNGTADRWVDNPHINFVVDERRRKAFLYGVQLVGLYHGDMPKKNKFDWLARDFKTYWGKAKFVEQHGGHLHHEAVETKGAIVDRTLTTIKDTDNYESSLGYDNISRVVQTFIYDKEKGLEQINYW